MNNFDSMLAIYQRLLSIERYSTTPKAVKENVAAHMYSVSFICLLLKEKHPELDSSRMLEMSIVHDLEECMTGDVMGNFKDMHPEVREALDKAAEEFLKYVLGKLDNKDSIKRIWREYKDQLSNEAKFVKIADILSRIIFMIIEHKLGNKYATRILENSFRSLELASPPEWILNEIREMYVSNEIDLCGGNEWV